MFVDSISFYSEYIYFAGLLVSVGRHEVSLRTCTDVPVHCITCTCNISSNSCF
jgi:hypothetical protein